MENSHGMAVANHNISAVAQAIEYCEKLANWSF